jgi:hypothetical protein
VRIVVLPLAAVLLTGCAGSSPAGSERTAAERFAAALTADNTASACDALAPLTRQELESSEQAGCAEALAKQELLRASSVRSSERFGAQAAVVVADREGRSDTWFLSRFDGRWLVVAAGCRSRGEQLPYDCDVEGA